jgi:hypothetical protein
MHSFESQLMFWRNMLPPSSGLENKESRSQCENWWQADVGDMFLRNVGWLSLDYTALFPRRKNSS